MLEGIARVEWIKRSWIKEKIERIIKIEEEGGSGGDVGGSGGSLQGVESNLPGTWKSVQQSTNTSNTNDNKNNSNTGTLYSNAERVKWEDGGGVRASQTQAGPGSLILQSTAVSVQSEA